MEKAVLFPFYLLYHVCTTVYQVSDITPVLVLDCMMFTLCFVPEAELYILFCVSVFFSCLKEKSERI